MTEDSALICASGIGDGLLMMIAAQHLKQRCGALPVVFHDQAPLLAPLFPGVTFLPHLPLEAMEEALQPYRYLFVQNDHSERAACLFRLRAQGRLPQLYFFFPKQSRSLPHRGYLAQDYLFDPSRSVATNIAMGCSHFLGTEYSKDNGLTLLSGEGKKYPKRVILHPTSNHPKREWGMRPFLTLADRLAKEGYTPIFFVGPKERRPWEGLGVPLPFFHHLQEVALYFYESGFFIGNDSGPGHLASNVGVPTLTLSGHPKHIALWRPDWGYGKIATPSIPLPSFAGARIRKNHWQRFLSVRKVLNLFKKLVHESCGIVR